MRKILLCSSLILLQSLAGYSVANTAFIRLSTFPQMSVADGRSTVTVNIEMRDNQGRSAPDGTRLVLTTTLGSFRESIVPTQNGLARAILQAGGIPGVATITVTAIGVDAAPSTLEFEFVGDRSQLAQAQEYIEVVAPTSMEYAVQSRVIGVSGPEKTVYIRYRDMEILADDVQINVPRFELRARRATLRVGRWSQDFSELYLQLNQRRGVGHTVITAPTPDTIMAQGRWIAFVSLDEQGKPIAPRIEERLGLVEVRPGRIRPLWTRVPDNTFEFEDLSESPSIVNAKKAVVFPRREIQFQRAEVLVGGATVLRQPLFVVNLRAQISPLITDQFVNINDNQLAINYPHYLSLAPGQTSLLRFRTGGRTGRSQSGIGGIFLDYELSWNRGDAMQGGLIFSGIARNDWVAGFRHYQELDARSNASLQIDIPSGDSIYGGATFSRQFDGFQSSISASATRSLRGLDSHRQDVLLIAEKDPTKLGNLPFRLFYGLTASASNFQFGNQSFAQEKVGMRLRTQSFPLTLTPGHTLSLGASVTRHFGDTFTAPLAYTGTASLSSRLTANASVVTTYDFIEDGFNDVVSGKHRLTMQGYLTQGSTQLSVLGSRSLDIDRFSLYVDASYRLSGLWRLSYGYTMDQYLDSRFLDYHFTVGYRLGWRELGLTWSHRTRRVGLQLLGAGF